MNERLRLETERLRRSWGQQDPAWLGDYLVAEVEDPRLNLSSVLSRHFLACALWGDRYRELMEAELRFAVVSNWLLEVRREVGGVEDWRAMAAALESGADNAEGWPVPACIHRARARLPTRASGVAVPDYLGRFLARAGRADAPAGRPDERGQAWVELVDTFMKLWAGALAAVEVPTRVSVIEPACGSANDYRFLAAAGLARFVDYTGVDLCAANVANARARFPGMRFAEGNVLALPAPDRAFDYGWVHDLFEHLSPEGFEAAVGEVCRVTRRGLCLGFFQMDEIGEHVVRPVEDYHVNTLSLTRTLEQFARHGFVGQAVHLGTFVRLRFGRERTPNPQAYLLALQARDETVPPLYQRA
jgi:SAM-dependent methyltransferase